MPSLSELKDLKVKTLSDATTILNRGLNTPSAKAEYKSLLEKDTELSDTIGMLERIERSLGGSLPIVSAPVTVPAPAITEKQNLSRQNEAWRSFLRGKLDNRLEEHRDITESTSSGQATLPTEFNTYVIEAAKGYAKLLDFANVRTSPNGRAVHASYIDDTNNGLLLVPEGDAAPDNNPANIDDVIISLDPLVTGNLYSIQLLQDTSIAFDFKAFLTKLQVGARVGRGLERAITLGLDNASSMLPNSPGLVNLAQTSLTTASLAAGVKLTDIINLFDSLDVGYQNGAIFQMNSSTRNALMLELDTTNRSIFVPSPTGPNGIDYLLGKPLVINQSLPNLGVADAVPILFGDLTVAVEIALSTVRVRNLIERYADTLKNYLMTYLQVGSAGIVANALQSIKLASS